MKPLETFRNGQITMPQNRAIWLTNSSHVIENGNYLLVCLFDTDILGLFIPFDIDLIHFAHNWKPNKSNL